MGKLNDLTVRHNRFVANMNVNIAISIESVSEKLVNMNKGQLLSSKDSKDNPLIHKGTGSEFLTNAYAKITKKSKPDLFLSGDFQRGMFLEVNENNSTYFIDSLDSKSGILTGNYGLNILGIPNKNEPESKKLTGAAFARLYKSKVLQK